MINRYFPIGEHVIGAKISLDHVFTGGKAALPPDRAGAARRNPFGRHYQRRQAMKRNILRIVVSIGVATGLLGLLETIAYAAGDPLERISGNHSEPQH